MIWRRRRLYYSHPVRTSRWSVALYFLFRNAKDYKDYVISYDASGTPVT